MAQIVMTEPGTAGQPTHAASRCKLDPYQASNEPKISAPWQFPRLGVTPNIQAGFMC